MNPTTTFPLEIWLHITDIIMLEDPDHAPYSLQHLVLTCRTMVPLCRRHIFSKIHIFDEKRKNRYIMLIKSNPELLRYLKHLLYAAFEAQNDLEFLRSLQAHASALQRLSLPGRCWEVLPEEIQALLVALIQLPTITHIDIMSFSDFPFSVLARCGNLDHIGLFNCTPHEDDLEEIPQLPISAKNPAPRIVECDARSRDALDALMTARHPGGEPLVDLSNVWHAHYHDGKGDPNGKILPPFLRILEMAALKTLELQVAAPTSFVPCFVSLASNTRQKLKRGEFEINVYDEHVDPSCGLARALGHLARTNVMEEVDISVRVHDCGFNPDSAFWVNLDKELTSPGAFPSLRSVKVVVTWYRPHPREQRQLMSTDLFPRLLESASVEFSFREDDL